MISVTYIFLASRRGYYLRKRWQELVDGTVAKRDTKEKIPDAVFRGASPPANPTKKTSAGDKIAAKYASDEQSRMNGSARAKRRDEMSLEEVWQFYKRVNPNQVKPQTMETTERWAKALLRCRCSAESRCVAHRLPSTITLSAAEELRNLRLRECRTCGIRDDAHPAQSVWKARHGREKNRPTHSFRALSPRTHYNEQGFLMDLLDFAVERADETGVRSKALTRQPTIIGGKKGIYPKPKYEPEQFFQLYAALSDIGTAEARRYLTMYGFVVTTGIREHPLTHFDKRWYDATRKRIRIPAEHMKGRGDNYRELDVPLSRWAAHFLETAITAAPEGTWLVWPSPRLRKGAYVPQQNFWTIEETLTRLAGFSRKISFHQFRGTMNSWLTNHRCERHVAEVPFFVRETLLGHALPKQVEAYLRFSEETLLEALDVIDCIFDAYEKARRGKLRAVAG